MEFCPLHLIVFEKNYSFSLVIDWGQTIDCKFFG